MRRSITVVVTVLATAGLTAQDRSLDERAIREIISSIDSGQQRASTVSTKDSIFWSGAYQRPVVGDETPVPVDDTAARVPSSQRSAKRTIRRIEISSAGDMAYEFSDVQLSWDMKTPNGVSRSETYDASNLRVWKKVDGKWLVAANASFPHRKP